MAMKQYACLLCGQMARHPRGNAGCEHCRVEKSLRDWCSGMVCIEVTRRRGQDGFFEFVECFSQRRFGYTPDEKSRLNKR